MNEILEVFIKFARKERAQLWAWISYRGGDHLPTPEQILEWTDRIKELDIVIRYLEGKKK